MIVPSAISQSIPAELAHIESWASNNNLKLNTNKLQEMIVKKPRACKAIIPTPYPGIARVVTMKILGIIIQDNLSMTAHVTELVSRAGRSLYALETLKAHGMPSSVISDVCRATLLLQLSYAAPAWHGYLNAGELARLESTVNKAKRWSLYTHTVPSLVDILDRADRKLFRAVLSKQAHVLAPFLPAVKPYIGRYNLRDRSHKNDHPATSELNSRGSKFYTSNVICSLIQ